MVNFLESERNLSASWHPEQVELMDRATNYKVGSRQAAIWDAGMHSRIERPGVLVCVVLGIA